MQDVLAVPEFQYLSKEQEKKLPYFKRRLHRLKKRLRGYNSKLDWYGGGVGTRGKNLGFMQDAKLQKAIKFARLGNIEGWLNARFLPYMPWKTHTCIWAAVNALHLEGDYVECGVHTGLLSMAVCDYLDFDKLDRKFYLFDTYNGIPLEGLQGVELAKSTAMNGLYSDVYEYAKRNFARFPNAILIKGVLPGSLSNVNIKKIAYLAIGLNNATYERQTIELLWDKLVPGAIIILEDYAYLGHDDQYEMWNDFISKKQRLVYTSPTGQGIIQK